MANLALPFGLCLAPYIFTAIADMVEWILTHNCGADFLGHYLDDFMTLGPQASPVCHDNLQACIRLCSILGLHWSPISVNSTMSVTLPPQGRTFLRRMINLLCTFRRDDHPIQLNLEFHLNLTWWWELFQSWDRLSFFLMPAWAPLPF